MASVTGRTAASIDQLLDQMVVAVRVTSGQLVYERRNGEEITAGELVDADLAAKKAWPLNSIFTATVPTNPNTLLGFGTWARFGKGRVLVSQDEAQTEFDSVEETGGAKTVTLTSDQIPAHTHSVPAHTHTIPGHSHGIRVEWGPADPSGSSNRLTRVGSVGPGGTTDTADGVTQGSGTLTSNSGGGGTSGSAGTGGAHENMPPYIVVYMWKRTA